MRHDDKPLAPARGIINGLAISALFWVVAFWVFRWVMR